MRNFPFGIGPRDRGSIPGRVIPKTRKMVLDATLLNTQHYKVGTKGKVEQSRERRAPFSIATTLRYKGGYYSILFLGLLHFTLDPYLIMLSVKQGGIKYHFLSFWYDSTWDWTTVSWTNAKKKSCFLRVFFFLAHSHIKYESFLNRSIWLINGSEWTWE